MKALNMSKGFKYFVLLFGASLVGLFGCRTAVKITDFTNQMENTADCMANVSARQLKSIEVPESSGRMPVDLRRRYDCSDGAQRAELYVRKKQCQQENEDPVIVLTGGKTKATLAAKIDNNSNFVLLSTTPALGFGFTSETKAEIDFEEVPLSRIPQFLFERDIRMFKDIPDNVEYRDEGSDTVIANVKHELLQRAYKRSENLERVVTYLIQSSPTNGGGFGCKVAAFESQDLCRPASCEDDERQKRPGFTGNLWVEE